MYKIRSYIFRTNKYLLVACRAASANKSIYMYDWYLPEFVLMIAEEDVVNKLVKTRRLIQERDIETIFNRLWIVCLIIILPNFC
jgi:hypothetical protein